MYTQTKTIKNKIPWTNRMESSKLALYPIDMSQFLTLKQSALNAVKILQQGNIAEYPPTTIAQYALAHWNQYLVTKDEWHFRAFLAHARWLVEHETPIGEDAGGWPITVPHAEFRTKGSWLSALTQGSAISVLTRAYQLTGEKTILEVLRRVVRTFEYDILEGGVSTPMGTHPIFFEEVAVYPSPHTLSGFIFAIFGLYDYVTLTGDIQIEKLIHRSLSTMHALLNEFDLGFWTCSDLLHRRLASPTHLSLQIELLEALARYSDCGRCTIVATRWKSYQRHLWPRLRYLITSHFASSSQALCNRMRAKLFPTSPVSDKLRICVTVPAFPVTGGILTVLEGVAQVTTDKWHIEYATQYVGPHPERFVIHRFGIAKMTPWLFPPVWLYVLAGFRKLISLLHHGADYHLFLPQDGVYTGAFTALAAKVSGRRVVCIDHGDLSLLDRRVNRIYRAERISDLARKNWHWTIRLLARWLLVLYWPSRLLLARISASLVDHFLIPGITGDGVEEVCQGLGIQGSRITRYASMINIDNHAILDAASKAELRKKNNLAADAIVIAIICRLSPEKGLNIAIESISHALSALSSELYARVRVIIAGDGPLRHQIADDILRCKLSQICTLWGETSAQDVISLLSFSDVFLYTSIRGACFPMAVLEAMASGCAVIASTEPLANEHLLAEGRGIAVPPGDVAQTSMALIRLLSNLELCQCMGSLARNYIVKHHSPTAFRQTLMRATYWSDLDELIVVGKES